MKYISTRSKEKEYSFGEVFIKGLADDGGLYVPKSLKKYKKEELLKLKDLNYNELSTEIISNFSKDFISKSELSSLIKKSYSTFREKEVVKISNIGELKLLELFHGPTLAFKDVAMQFIGNLYEYYLNKNDKKINIVVATSGDTGAAAINAIKGKSNLNIFVLHPNDRISSVQRKIMTTVDDENVFNIAIDGNFDDCQNIVKSMFSDLEFSKSINMSGVNSINWVRIIAQSVYYFYSYFKLSKETISFSVPTGNFGDVFAGYLAKKMGLPINKLIVATNENNILERVINTGEYKPDKVKPSISPSMDIQVASNFERLLFYVVGQDDQKVSLMMNDLSKNGFFKLNQKEIQEIKKDFEAVKIDDETTQLIIKNINDEFKFIVDPHTATGFGAAKKMKSLKNIVVLGTAHPFKFSDTVKNAIGKNLKAPSHLKIDLDKKEKFDIIENSNSKIKNYILSKVQ